MQKCCVWVGFAASRINEDNETPPADPKMPFFSEAI